jgi:hypothetical protein
VISLVSFSLGDVGGVSGIAAAMAWGTTQLVSWLNKKKDVELKEDDQEAKHVSAAVTDSATVNSVMLDSMKEMRIEIKRLHDLNAALSLQNQAKDEKIIQMQKEIERLVGELTKLYDRLEDLRSS